MLGHVSLCWAPRPGETRFDEWEATADPVAVAAVNELVGTAGEATLRGILAGRQPRDESWDVEISDSHVRVPKCPK